MRVLFVALSTRGSGETLIGLSLAKRLRHGGIEPYFIVDATADLLLRGSDIPYSTLDVRMGPFAELVIGDVVATERPDVIVLSDYFTYYQTMSNVYMLDPWLIEQYDLPVIPIDVWEWEHTSFQIDLLGGEHIKCSRRILDMPAYLRPVPLCHLSTDTPKAYPFPLTQGRGDIVSARTRKHLRRVLGLEDKDRLVVTSLAPWQKPDHRNSNCTRIAAEVPEVLLSHLSTLPANVHIVNVGERLTCLDKLSNVRVHYVPPCGPHRFHVLLGSADLFVTLNIAATSLARAVLAGVPGLVLVNNRDFGSTDDVHRFVADTRSPPDDDVVQWLLRNVPVYPFRMWPLGFYNFLEPLLLNNPYRQTFAEVDLFEGTAVRETLNALLFNAGRRREMAEAQARYKQRIGTISDVNCTFRGALQAVGLQHMMSC